jgi:hypothetical protein
MVVYFKGELMNKFQLRSITKLLKKYQNSEIRANQIVMISDFNSEIRDELVEFYLLKSEDEIQKTFYEALEELEWVIFVDRVYFATNRWGIN